ncbi:MAG: hypothetical protein AB1898_05975 [Acidobacteriota bacterium]
MASSKSLKGWLLWFAVAGLIVLLRLGWVLYDRSRPYSPKPPVERRVDLDLLVVVPKFRVKNFADVHALNGQRLWVKAGYAAEYFVYGPGKTPAAEGMLFEPLQELMISDIVQRSSSPGSSDRDILAVFEAQGQRFATVIGRCEAGTDSYQWYLDDLFFGRDPREIYDHWQPDVWEKIRSHQLERQMTMAQVMLSLGVGTLITTEAGGLQLYQFSRKPGGLPGKTRVRFAEGRVKEFQVVP